MNINRAIVVGRATKKPELRSTRSGTSVVSFSIATNSYYTDKNGNKAEETQFHNISLFGKLADIASKYIEKGQEVGIEGRMQTQKYEDKNGQTQYFYKIVGENLQLGAKPKGKSGQEEAVEDVPSSNDNEEIQIEDVPF